MRETDFSRVVDTIREKDPRYKADAYAFVRESLDYTVKMLDRPRDSTRRHVSGAELLDGLRVYALQEFGPMAVTVLNAWGVHGTSDIGDIVFHLVESGVLGKTEEDKREDFVGIYDFAEAFTKPFLPTPKKDRKEERGETPEDSVES